MALPGSGLSGGVLPFSLRAVFLAAPSTRVQVRKESTMPRRLLSLMIGLTFVSAVWAFDTWPQWRGPHRDGVSAEKGLLDLWEDEPPLVWKAQGVGNGYAGVAVVGGVVFTMGGRKG
jgi:outer membrane protein assembly factor BamB